MRRFQSSLLIALVAAFVAGGGALAANPEFPSLYQRPDRGEIEVVTALASYVFSVKDATLKSLFLYYETYGVRPLELVPGIQQTELVEVNEKTLDPNYPILRRDRPILKPLTQFTFSFPAKAYAARRLYGEQTIFPFALGDENLSVSFDLSRWEKPDKDTLVLEFTGQVGPLAVTKRFTIHNDPYYTIDLDVVVDNPTGQDLSSALRMTVGSYTPNAQNTPALVFQYDGKTRDAVLSRDSYDVFNGLGLLSKESVFFLLSRNGQEVAAFSERETSGDRQFGVTLPTPKGKTTYSFSLYGGRRRFLLMSHVGLGTLDSPGVGARLMVPVIQFLQVLYRLTGNFGWAIILFTLATRVILYPLMRRQIHSAAKMQRIAPRLKRIQERFRDDRQLQQQKLMELYKKEGINPLSGCLPLLIQLPFLILLWKAILYCAEEIHLSAGFLWMPDLSLRDPYFIFVVLTTAAMILQQKLMTPVASSGESRNAAFIGYIFPIVMAIFLWNFPAGLWMYYFLTTIVQVGQQYVVNRELARADAKAGAAGGGAGQADGELEGGDSADGERKG